MASASGQKTMVINPRERAISPDINRLQQFGAADFATALAYLFDYQGAGVANSAGDGSVGSVTNTPLRAEILGGFTVRPQIGSANTLVDPGILICVKPDSPANPDDSPYKVINDPGVTNGATLQMIANGSGSTQIQVVECQRVETVLETDNRDIFDPASGLFAPALVNKVIASRLQYRVRSMTLAGGIMPANGWLILVVALVPNAATTWDDCPFVWDVRPLVSDRAFTPVGAFSTTSSALQRCEVSFAAGTDHLSGRVEAVGPSGRMLGGDLGYSPADTFLDLSSSELQPSGFAPAGDTPYYLFLAEFFNLPRWCRYTDVASGNRKPGRLRGIPVLAPSVAPPVPVTNQNLVGIAGPAAFNFPGFIAGPGQAVCVWAGMVNPGGVSLKRGYTDGSKRVYQHTTLGFFTPTSKTNAASTWNIPIGVNCPEHARALLFQARIGWIAFAAGVAQIDWDVAHDDGSGTLMNQAAFGSSTSTTTQALNINIEFWVPIPPVPAPLLQKIVISYAGATAGYGTPPDTSDLTLLGWQL
jgi:hypothetical protein